MLNLIEAKESKMNEIRVSSLFNHMTDADFMALHNAGALKEFCDALSLDLQPKDHEKDYTYTA